MRAFKLVFRPEKCKGCELCRSVCPKGVIGIAAQVNAKGYCPAKMTRNDACVGCTSCALVCPDCAIEIFEEE